MKKVISLFLSAMMILTSVLCVNFSAFAKDIESGSIKLGKNTVKASELVYYEDELNETNSTYYWYSFVPDETAVYKFESHYTVSDNTDPMIYLCDKNKNEIADYDDIGGSENRNFRLQTSLIKGETYYLYFQEYNDLTSFEFTVDKTQINFSFTLAQKHTLTRGYDSSIYTDDNGDEYDYYNLGKVISSEGNTITETKEDGTKVTYTCKNTKANEDDEDDFSFVDGNGNLFPYQIDCDSAQSINHLKTGDNVQCYFTVRSDDYNIDVPFTIDIKDFDISGITFTLAEKHTLTQGYDSYIDIDDNREAYDHYNFGNVIYSEGGEVSSPYNNLKAKFTDDTKISESEMKKYYEEHKADYYKDEVKASHILISTVDDNGKELSEAKKKEAKKKAEEVLKKAKSGEEFSELAKEYSDDPGSAAKGGDLGYFTKGQMVQPFEEAAFSLKSGEISGLVESEYGYHIIKVYDKIDKQLTFDEVKDEIKKTLTEDKYMESIEAITKKAKVEKNESVIKKVKF